MLTTRSIIPRRQLSAIMFADMVGYSALMQGDETLAYRLRKRYREALSGAVERHLGEIVQHYGDGALVLFRSAVEAAHAAVAIQRDLQAEPAVPVRIGIHLADVVRDADGAYGAGVNLAARIEALAAPGSVLVSDRVVRELQNKPELPSLYLGEYQLKNIADPVPLHALADPGIVIPRPPDGCGSKRRRPCSDAGSGGPSAPAAAPARVGGLAGLLYELHRRRVDQVAAMYMATVVGVLTVLQVSGSALGLPDWAARAALAAALVALPVVLGLAWLFDVTPTGIDRTGPSDTAPRLRNTAAGALGGACLLAAVAVAPLDRASGSNWTSVDPAPAADAEVEPAPAVAAEVEPLAAAVLDERLVVQSRVLRVGGRIRVQVSLMDAERGLPIWSTELDRPYDEDALSSLESEVAGAVSRALRETLGPDAATRGARERRVLSGA